MDQFSTIQQIAIWIVPILFAVTLHEAAHGLVAFKLGDDTAYQQGRISLNPFKHIELFGTIILPLVLMLTVQFAFGWAKPVPVNPHRLRKPKRDLVWVSLAGPAANGLMALFWIILLKLSLMIKTSIGFGLFYMSQAGILINLMLMSLNLLPIPPLDGSKLVSFLLPPPWDRKWEQATNWGLFLVLILAASGILAKMLTPFITFIYQGLLMAFQIKF